MKDVLDDIQEYNWSEFFNTVTSGKIVVRLLYTRIVLTSIGDRPLRGKPCRMNYATLPPWMKSNKYIISSNRINTRQIECDSLCVFRSLAEHFVITKDRRFGMTKGTIQKMLFVRFMKEVRKVKTVTHPRDFEGVYPSEMECLEKMIQVPINVYSFEVIAKGENRKLFPKNLKAVPLFFSKLEEQPEITECNLLHYMGHIVYLASLDKALGLTHCPICEKREFGNNICRHVKACANRIKISTNQTGKCVYHSGKRYNPPTEIFEQIEEEFGYSLDNELKSIHYLAAYDLEAWFEEFDEIQIRGKATESESRLHTLAIGVCSNVPGYREPKIFWADGSCVGFVGDFIDYLLEMSAVQYEILKNRLQSVFQILKMRLYAAIINENDYGIKKYKALLENLDNFIRRLVVVGFNSSKFDLRLMRETFAIELYERFSKNIHVQMRDGRYSRIVCPDLIFVDQLNYLANKTSYDSWILNSLSIRCKGKLPYSWINDLSCLSYPGLPPYETWYSSLRGHNVLDSDYLSYNNYISKGLTSERALANLGLAEPPKPGREVLEQLKREFRDKGFITFRDFLREYLINDIVPMVAACEKQSETFYHTYGINIYRNYSSIPGVAVKQSFRYLANVTVYVPSEDNYKVFQTTPGGQSLLIQLEAVSGLTKIRASEFGDSALTCQSIFSLDSSLHYGKCMEDLVCGPERVRLPDSGFVPEFTDKKFAHYYLAEKILRYWAWKKQISIQTYQNGGEKICSMGPRKYKPDGVSFDGKKTRIFEVYGCLVHFCRMHPKPLDQLHPVRKHKATRERMTWGEVKGLDKIRINALKREYNVRKVKIIYTCEWKRDFESADGVKHEEYQHFLTRYPEYNVNRTPLTESELLEEIRHDRIYGFIVADFDCPPWLRAKTELFPLLFKRSLVERKDTGPIMSEILEQLNLLRKPSNELITSHFAKGILASTPLVKFYIEMGVEVSNVRRVIEYNYTDSLKKMVQNCSDLRYKATTPSGSKEDKILGDLSKSIVVSTYGKLLQNPQKYTNVKYLTEDKVATTLFSQPFVSCDYVGRLQDGRELYEVKKRSKTINYSSPIHMGAMVLLNSKLRILNLIYRCLEPHIDPRSYTFFGSFTDSVSIVCAESDFSTWVSKWVLPSKVEDFEKIRSQYFVIPGDSEEAKKSKFKAGIFKIEWQGTCAIGLGPKTYAVSNGNDIVKMAARSVPMTCFKNLTMNQFFDVLHKNQPITVNFFGFNYVCGSLLFEKMSKTAIKAFYVKRELLADCSTRTLNV